MSAIIAHQPGIGALGRIDAGANQSAIIAGNSGLISDASSVSLSGGHAVAGNTETLAHGTPGFRANTFVGFRGAPPAQARVVTTLADVILALQEQGLAA